MKHLLFSMLLVLTSAVCTAQDAISAVTVYAPHYPPIALAEGAAENIKVKVVVNERGEVIDANVLNGVNIFLKSESERAAKKWIFNKSSAAKREQLLQFSYVVLYPAKDTGPDVEFSLPFDVTIRQHQRETSGPSRQAGVTSTGILLHESGHADSSKPQ